MLTLHTVAALRAQVSDWRRAGERIAFVPTMGNLHAAHIDLIHNARRLADRVVCSIFVNPTQFGPGEDYASYPRTLADDSELLRAADTDLLYAPNAVEMYPHGTEGLTQVLVPGLTDILCGAVRPGHFTGVSTVVTKLFNQVQPDVAVFGEKDWQQLLVVRRMTAELDIPVEIVGVRTYRERSGLAMSSRNSYLSDEERRTAPVVQQTLQRAVVRLRAGDSDYPAIEAEGVAALRAAGLRPDYFEVRCAEDLAPPAAGQRLMVLVAAWLGRARLIDNLHA